MVTVVLGHPVHVFRRTVNFSLYSFYCSYMVAHPQPNSYFSIRASETAARSFFSLPGLLLFDEVIELVRNISITPFVSLAVGLTSAICFMESITMYPEYFSIF